jgi:hypothetical protein
LGSNRKWKTSTRLAPDSAVFRIFFDVNTCRFELSPGRPELGGGGAGGRRWPSGEKTREMDENRRARTTDTPCHIKHSYCRSIAGCRPIYKSKATSLDNALRDPKILKIKLAERSLCIRQCLRARLCESMSRFWPTCHFREPIHRLTPRSRVDTR